MASSPGKLIGLSIFGLRAENALTNSKIVDLWVELSLGFIKVIYSRKQICNSYKTKVENADNVEALVESFCFYSSQ